mgnify:CR=1 FL=1
MIKLKGPDLYPHGLITEKNQLKNLEKIVKFDIAKSIVRSSSIQFKNDFINNPYAKQNKTNYGIHHYVFQHLTGKCSSLVFKMNSAI